MKDMLRILNWNVEANRQTRSNQRSTLIGQRVKQYGADVICLTEAFPDNLPGDGYRITSDLSGWGTPEQKGARKVVLWSRYPWDALDVTGSDQLPPGRFVSACINGVRFVGIVIPYHAYRTADRWGDNRYTVWQGAKEYLIGLQSILSNPACQQRTVVLGDFNLQIPPRGYPSQTSEVNRLSQETFLGWQLPTAGIETGMEKPFIDHIALTPDLQVMTLDFFSRYDASNQELSDHNGVIMSIGV